MAIAYKKNEGVSIRISNKNLGGNDILALTKTQLNKINNAKRGVQLNLSASQLQYMEKNRRISAINSINCWNSWGSWRFNWWNSVSSVCCKIKCRTKKT